MRRPRLIRKYVNRRLYDTAKSRYVNLADLRELVLGGHDISVVDQPSGRDITSSVLLQIIGDTELDGRPLLSPDFLCELLRTVSRAEPDTHERLTRALKSALPPATTGSYGASESSHAGRLGVTGHASAR
jgi:polyhydroxyalkanoate synthesis repressor PhaR